MEISAQSEVLENRWGLPIRLELRQPASGVPRATVIVCHGFKGFKAWGFFPFVGEQLARDGYATVNFDFSGNGIGDEPTEFTRLDLFERNTYTQELEDLQRVISWLRREAPLPGAIREGPVGLLGHSRAAVPVMVTAREDPSVTAVVTWAGVGRLLRVSEAQLARWKTDGRMEFQNARTGQRMAMRYDFVEDVHAHSERFDLVTAAREMRAAHLIVHGSADLAVDPEEAELLRAGREDRCRVEIVEGASHTFQVVHPFEGPTRQLEEALDHTRRWLVRYLA